MIYPLKAGWKPLVYALLGLMLVLGLGAPGFAQIKSSLLPAIDQVPALNLGQPQAAPAANAPGLSDRQDLASFLDDFFADELSARSAPGAVVAVVNDGEIFFAKGYGYANVEQKTPVDAERTLFRVASLSKPFTTTATMQLAEQGLLDLDGDIQDYLGDRVRLKNPFPKVVTFAHLMTHTDGSTKRRIGLAAETEASLQPLEDYLADHLPPIVHPPGELFSYSSHAITLLGYLVQNIAGQPFVDYINDHILQPLEMERSSFAQPPPHLADLATGYQKQGDRFQAVPYLYLNIGPAAALSTTATDMAHFMIAHLQGGAYKNHRILEPESVEEMHRIHFRSHPNLPGTGYGFRERRINGLQTIGHLGSLRGYSSSVTLMPDQNIGLFIASNSFSGVHGRLLQKFFDRYFPAPQNAPTPETQVDPSQLDLERFTGTYRDLEYPRHTIAKLTAPYEHINIRLTETGLEIRSPALFFNYDPPNIQLEPIAPLLFYQKNNNNTLTAFEADANGNILYAYNPIYDKMGTFVKIAWYENLWFHAGLLAIATLLFFSGLWIYPLHPTVRRLQGKPFAMPLADARAWKIAGTTSSLNLTFLVGFPLSLWLYGAWKLAYGMPWFGRAFLALPILSALLTVVMVAIALWTWSQKQWSTLRRMHYNVLALAAVVFTVLLGYWRVLGFQF